MSKSIKIPVVHFRISSLSIKSSYSLGLFIMFVIGCISYDIQPFEFIYRIVSNSTTTIMVSGRSRQRYDTIVGYRTTRWIVPQPSCDMKLCIGVSPYPSQNSCDLILSTELSASIDNKSGFLML